MILVYLFAAVVLGHGYPIGFVLICIGISMRAYGFAVCGFCDLYVDGISVFVVTDSCEEPSELFTVSFISAPFSSYL